MNSVRTKQFVIQSEKQWSAITSAVRIELILALRAIGPCSIRELAEQLNRPADGLYHHMRILTAAGLIVEVESRNAGTQTEVVYDAIADDITVDRNIRRKPTRERMVRLFRTMIQHAQRMMEAALRSDVAVLEKDHQTLKLQWITSWLDERQLAGVRRHQQAIDRIMQEGLRRRTGRQFAVLTYLAPVVRPRGSRKPSR